MTESISILGIQTQLAPIARNELRGLNADMLLRFFFYSTVFNGQPLCIIQIKNKDESITPLKYKRITNQVETVVQVPVAVLLEDSLIYIKRERLINQGVYFIISDKYAFLPSLIVNAQVKKKKARDRLSPAAQYILLYYLSSEDARRKFTIKELEKAIPYNYIAIARAIISLEDCGLCQTAVDSTRTKQIHFTDLKRELWEKSQQYLLSPIKRILYSDSKPEGEFSICGLNALSHYSHLNPEPYETLAIWEKHFDFSAAAYNEIEGQYSIEIWNYPTSIPHQKDDKVVNKLSLYLSMKNEPDPRIEKELEIMIAEMKW